MKITNIKLWQAKGSSAVKARGEVEFDNCLTLKNMSIVRAEKGLQQLFVSWTQIRVKGKYIKMAGAYNSQSKNKFEDRILEFYQKWKEDNSLVFEKEFSQSIPDTKIKFYPSNRGKTKGVCHILFDNELIVKGFTVVKGKYGLFLSNPANKGKNGKFFDVAVPIGRYKKILQEEVIEKFKVFNGTKKPKEKVRVVTKIVEKKPEPVERVIDKYENAYKALQASGLTEGVAELVVQYKEKYKPDNIQDYMNVVGIGGVKFQKVKKAEQYLL